VAAAVVLFVLLAGGGDDGAQQPTSHSQPRSTTRAQSQSPPKTTGPKARRAPNVSKTSAVQRIVVRGGKPVGGIERLDFERGERVSFTVRSDVADEVHVHGYDIAKDVRANGTVRFAFPADIEGVFEVELESAHLTIAKLRIGP
jgi:hypothetical protein